MNPGIRTRSGMMWRSMEITMLENTSTNVVARPMPTPEDAAVEMASVGHMPSTRRNVGFSFKRPLVNT